MRTPLLLAATLVWSRAAIAQQRPIAIAPSSRPVQLDGRLDDLAWQGADSIFDFRQREPVEGAPASERTVVRVVGDAAALYVGVRAYDREAAGIRATQLRRDADLSSDDNVTLLVDSFHDRRSAFVFRVNPNGARWDAQFSGTEDVNENWNGIWDVRVARDSAGWTAEIRIPFRTLRFRTAGDGDIALGFNVRRLIRRKNEEDLWQSYRRVQGLHQLSAAGTLAGSGAVRSTRDVALMPYVLGRAVEPEHDTTGARIAAGSIDAKAGLDVKVGVSPTMTADLTFNTDFAQVEADRQVINLTRFPFFFPEKREFFLESSGIFDFGTPGRVQLLYSRRIGLNDNGAPVPIVAGARLYGKLGPWGVGLLSARTGSGDDATDVVMRVRHDVFARSYVGAMTTARLGPGAGVAQWTGGVDMAFPLLVGGQNLEPRFWIAGSQTPATAGTPLAWRLSTDFPNDLFDNFVSLYRVDAGFDPALGFVRRSGVWETTGHVDFMPRPGVLGIRQLDIEFPIPTWDIIANETGTISRWQDWQTASFEWRPLGGSFQSGDQFEVNVQRLFDAPVDSFEIFPGVAVPPGRYWWTRGELQYQTSAGRPLSIEASLNWGGFYDGHSVEATLETTWRGGGHLILAADATRSTVRLPAGRFTALETAGRLEYAFNPNTDFLAFVQYNNEDRRVDFNLRFHWIPVIGDDVYVVWNSGFTTATGATYAFPSGRSLTHPLNGALVIKAVHRLAP